MIDQEKLAHPRVHPMIRPPHYADRVAVSDAYDDFSLPPYGKDDAFVLNLVALGLLGFYVFLKEDPEHFYGVPFGAAAQTNHDAVRVARERFRKVKEGLESAPMP